MGTYKIDKKLFTNDVGIVFRVWAKTDISLASSILIKVKKPDGTVVSWTASVANDNDYYAVYTSASGDLDSNGDYLLSLYVTFPDGSIYTGETALITIYNQFEDLP